MSAINKLFNGGPVDCQVSFRCGRRICAGTGKALGKSAVLVNTRCGMPLVRLKHPEGRRKTAILPERNAAARSLEAADLNDRDVFIGLECRSL